MIDYIIQKELKTVHSGAEQSFTLKHVEIGETALFRIKMRYFFVFMGRQSKLLLLLVISADLKSSV